MNAPRQGLFASLLITSFILHSILIVLATNAYLKESRAVQGDLLTRQIALDSIPELATANTISLSLLASRYATNPDLASLRIFDDKGQLLATAGNNKTRMGDVFVRDATNHDKNIGRIEVVLIKPSFGEIVQDHWLPLLGSLVLHIILWLCYRKVARPNREELQQLHQQEAVLLQQVAHLKQQLQEKPQQAPQPSTVEPTQPDVNSSQQNTSVVPENKKNDEINQYIYLNINFYDPKNLLALVNQEIIQFYLNTLNDLLNKTRHKCAEYYHFTTSQFEVVRSFGQDGAVIRIDKSCQNAIPAIILFAILYQSLSIALHQHRRQENLFSVQIRCAVAEVLNTQFNAADMASQLAQSIHAQELAIYLKEEHFRPYRHLYELTALPHNFHHFVAKEALLLSAVSMEMKQLIERMRAEILNGVEQK